MNLSRNDIVLLQRRLVQLDHREDALRSALRLHWRRRVVAPATLTLAVAAAAAVSLHGAYDKPRAAHRASAGSGRLRDATLLVELIGALLSVAAMVREQYRHGMTQGRCDAES